MSHLPTCLIASHDTCIPCKWGRKSSVIWGAQKPAEIMAGFLEEQALQDGQGLQGVEMAGICEGERHKGRTTKVVSGVKSKEMNLLFKV